MNKLILNADKENTIVFLHGNSHSHLSFKNQMHSPKLQDYRLVFIDLPGHGDSPKSSKYSVKNLASDVADLCLELKTKNIVIAGHSLGGHVALNTLKSFSPLGLFLFGTPPLKNPLDFNAFLPNENSSALRLAEASDCQIEALMNEMNYDGAEKNQAQSDYLRTDPLFRQTILDDILSNEHEDEIKLIKTFTGQVLFLLATQDSLINNSYIREGIFSDCENENCQLKEIETGHSPHVEDPETFNIALANFCDLIFNKSFLINSSTNERVYSEQRN